MSGPVMPKLSDADIAALERLAPFKATLSVPTSFILLATIQLALRHPGVEHQKKESMITLAGLIVEHLSVSPAVRDICEAGWKGPHGDSREK